MNRETKLTPQENQELVAEQQKTQSSSAREFTNVEEMLRHDALHTPVPPTIAHRLEESVKDLPPAAARAWWRRLLGPKTP